jgi:hypothetical protein
MKIITTVRPVAPAIRAVRMPLIRARAGPGLSRGGAGWHLRGGVITGRGWRVLVGPCDAGGSVMASLACDAGGSVMASLALRTRTGSSTLAGSL